MPIHRIDLPHTPNSSRPSLSPTGSTVSSFNLDTDTIEPLANPHFKNVSSVSLLRNKTKSSVHLSLKSVNSLHSMLSNQSATTEYSPNLIDQECGDLLKIIDLDINEEPETISSTTTSASISKSKSAHFHLHSDDEDQNDYSSDDLDNTILHPPLHKTSTSNDTCGCHYYDNDDDDDSATITENISPINFQSIPNSTSKTDKWVFVLIGLPACGKSTMIKHFIDFVKTQTHNTIRAKTYNAGDIRRVYEQQGHKKFDFNDLQSSQKLRNFYAFEALKTLTTDLQNDKCDIGILDATNTTCERRASILDYIRKQNDMKSNSYILNPLIFEVKCSNRALRRFNIDRKSQNKDYIHVDHDTAIHDFLGRIKKYEKTYDKVTVQEIKKLNVKYFGIDNVGDSIYYDCGLNHHDNIRHRNLTFRSIALNLLYQFLITYRTHYAYEYLTAVDTFFTGGYYNPLPAANVAPVQLDEVPKPSTVTNFTLPKVLSSTRLTH